MLRIRDVYTGSRIQMFPIPDFASEFFPRIRIKKIKYFNPKNWFLISRKYDPGCSSRIRILFFYPSRIPDQEVKKHRIPDPDPQKHCLQIFKKAIRGRGSPVNLSQPVLVGVVGVEIIRELFGALLDQVGRDALHAGGGRAGPREELVYKEAGKLVASH